MEQQLQEIINRLMTKQTGSQNQQETCQTTQPSFKCDKCQDTEYIYDPDTNTAKTCECHAARVYERILQSCGISEVFRQKTFKNFDDTGKSEEVKAAKKAGVQYVMDFNNIRGQRNNSICFLGQVGSGKTHLSCAIANNLMSKCIGVLYMPYREAIISLKQSVRDEENYNREIKKYKTAPVLLLDDLFKGFNPQRDKDMNYVYEIINHRYLGCLPVIVSSEYGTDQFLEFDEAVGSRIIEMCKGRIVELKGEKLNYRLR